MRVGFIGLGRMGSGMAAAIALTSKGNIDKRRFLEFLTSGNFNAPVFRIFGELVIADTPAPAGFAAPLALKDIRLALKAGEDLRAPMPFAGVLHERFVELIANGGEQMDWSAIGRLPLRDAAKPFPAVPLPSELTA